MTRQPEWEFVANLGDADPIEHGGYMIFVDKTGVYCAEAEYWDPDERKLYRIQLDRMDLVEGKLILFRIANRSLEDRPLPHPLMAYVEWFDEHVHDPQQRQAFCSSNPMQRAMAYRALYEVQGWENGDGYALTMSAEEMTERWKEYIK